MTMLSRKTSCVVTVTYIDFTAAFDSTSHKYLDGALKRAGASRKKRALFRVIYEAAAGTARVLGINGEHKYSHTFEIQRGVIQARWPSCSKTTMRLRKQKV